MTKHIRPVEPSFTVTPNPAYGLECVIKNILNVEELIINPVDIPELVEALNRYYYHEFMTKDEGDLDQSCRHGYAIGYCQKCADEVINV